MCDLVYAEICGHFAGQGECDQFLADTEIRVESLTREASFLASLAWRAYRRRGGRRVRILPDFIIGAMLKPRPPNSSLATSTSTGLRSRG